MKIFETKKMIFAGVTALVFLGTIYGLQSCGKNELELNAKEDTPIISTKSFQEITPENTEFKSMLLNTKNIVKLKEKVNSITRQNAPSKVKNEAINQQMHELAIASMKMFKSYGIEYENIQQYVDSANDPKIVVMGMVFIAIQKSNFQLKSGLMAKSPNNKRFKAPQIEETTTTSYGKVMDCLGRVFLGVNLSEFVFERAALCTLETAIGIAGRVACRTLGVVGAAIAVADFGDCMGWYNLW